MCKPRRRRQRQLELSETKRRMLGESAKLLGIPVAEFVRRAIRYRIDQDKSRRTS